MANIFTIGQSALVASQAAMSTTGQNIANAATPGYSRQSVVQAAVTPQPLGFGYLGQGTQIQEVQRAYDEHLGKQMVSAQSASSQLQAQYTQIQQINNMLADPAAGLSPVMQDFFNSLQEVSLQPADASPRQSLLSAATALSSRFQDFQTRLGDLRQGLNLQIASGVQTVNQAAQQLATLNQAIERAQSAANGKPSNDLLDQRNQLLLDLSKQVKVSVVQQDGRYSVFIGNGQPLVVGSTVHGLKTITSKTDPSRLEVAYNTQGQQSFMSADNLAGGVLGGLLEFRSQILEPTQNALGRIALGLASGVNQLHKTGYTLDGLSGGDFFKLPPMSVNPSSANSGTAKLLVNLSDAKTLTTSDYRLQWVGGQYNLRRSADNQLLSASANLDDVKAQALTQGFSLHIDSGAMADGDEFLIRPTANVAAALSVAVSNTNAIAAAGAASTPSDNSNILKILDLQTSKTLNAGTLSYQSAYAQLVNQVGSKTRELDVTSTSAGQILSQSERAVQDVSGVNLDEEAADLMRYQQAYQAAGKMMQIAKQMFDSLLSMS